MHNDHCHLMPDVPPIVTAFIASRQDYCNALLYGVAKTEIQRLQTVMNAAARLVGGLGRYDHVTPVLRDNKLVTKLSKWQFLLSTKFVVRARLTSEASAFNSSYWSQWTAEASFSTTRRLMRATRTKVGTRSFRVAAPQTWNFLPLHLCSSTISRDQFRIGLKSHLFMCAYTWLYLRELLRSELTNLLTYIFRNHWRVEKINLRIKQSIAMNRKVFSTTFHHAGCDVNFPCQILSSSVWQQSCFMKSITPALSASSKTFLLPFQVLSGRLSSSWDLSWSSSYNSSSNSYAFFSNSLLHKYTPWDNLYFRH